MPVCGAYFAIAGPSTQRMHSLLPGAGEYLPAMHALQVVAAAMEYFPAMHCRQTLAVVAACVVEYRPALQSAQTVCFDAV
jgi:hypothetical protein